MKPLYWVLLGVAVIGGGAIWYSKRNAPPAPVPSQAKPDARSIALAAASNLLARFTT